MSDPSRKAPPFAGLDLAGDLANVARVRARAESPPRAALEAVSEAEGFVAREPRRSPAAPAEPSASIAVRGRGARRKTGRTYHFAVKLRPQDAQQIYDWAEADDCLIAEVIEKAIEAWRRERGEKQP